jgi:hypothetical protein
MFIIFGSPRSGTTLLSETLNGHQDIFVPTETDFIIPAAFLIDRIADEKVGKRLLVDLILNSKDSQSITSHLSKGQIVAALDAANYDLCSILKAVYGELASVNQKKIAGDKSPNDLMYPQIFETVGLFESDIKFIHIIRNVRDVCDSLRMVSWAPEDVVDYFPRIWSFSNCHLHQLLKDKPNYWLVKYESLISNFDNTIEKTCDFLGVPMDLRMLDPQIRGARLGMLPHHKNLNKKISDVSQNRVRLNDKTPRIEKKFYEQASEGLTTFGYAEE